MAPAPSPAVIPPLCSVCTHLRHGTGSHTCDAFPEGIPGEILAGEPHVNPFPGDNGRGFLKRSAEPSFFIAETGPRTLIRVTCSGSCERYVPILDEWDPDDRVIPYLLSVPLAIRPVDTFESEAFVESSRRCIDSMNPCMREVRRMMYLCAHERPET